MTQNLPFTMLGLRVFINSYVHETSICENVLLYSEKIF